MIEPAAIQDRLGAWWFDYDRGDFARWPDHFTADARFTCRSDSGATDFEDFIRADLQGRDQVVRWQTAHREASPYPLRHHATDVHVRERRPAEVDFGSYLFVTQILGGAVSHVSTGVVLGTVRKEAGALRIAALHVVLDFTDSVVFTEAVRHPL